MNWFACDLDHTLSDAAWRDPLLGQWDDYNAAADADLPVPEVLLLVQTLVASGVWQGIAWTARPERWRGMTLGWLARHDAPFEELLMRAEGDFRRAPEVKLGLLASRPGGLEAISFALDDRVDVVEALRGAGITAFLTHVKSRRQP